MAKRKPSWRIFDLQRLRISILLRAARFYHERLWSAARRGGLPLFSASLLAPHVSKYRVAVHGQQAVPRSGRKRQQAAALQSDDIQGPRLRSQAGLSFPL
ncbi:MAG: hypothetical protein WCD04_18470 [Terriglobia bacterium]